MHHLRHILQTALPSTGHDIAGIKERGKNAVHGTSSLADMKEDID
jgi:hypothetical protein